MEYTITANELAKLESGKAKERKEIRNKIQSSAFTAGEVVQVGNILRRMAPIDRGVAIDQGRA